MTVTPLDVLAHEIRSPVAALVAIAEAYPGADAETRRRLIELARAAMVSLERLVVGRADVGGPVRIDAGELVRDVAETASVMGRPVAADVGSGLIVLGSVGRLRQALDNLTANAVGHAPAGSVVTLSALRVGPSVVVTVHDEGEGIAPDDLDRIFQPGVRLTTARPGSGLGLAVVREIVLEHGGEVEVESRPGQGATFRLVLPAASDAP